MPSIRNRTATGSLYGAQYFARLTQRLINALTAQTNYGALYQVDMRLRPSGRSGPVATQIEGFASYQETEAWTWEHMALTRARVVSASPAFAARVERVIRDVLCGARAMPALIAGDVVEMRAAIAKEKGDDERWDLKYAAGGLVDIEFIAQYLQLVHAAGDAGHSRHLDRARARQGLAAAACCRWRTPRCLRPAVRLYHDLDADLAAVPARAVRSEDRRGRAAAPAGAGSRRAGFCHARRHVDRDPAEGARELRADFGQGAVAGPSRSDARDDHAAAAAVFARVDQGCAQR